MKIYDPRIKVRLIKTVTRFAGAYVDEGKQTYDAAGNTAVSARYRKIPEVINLHPLLGEMGGVRTTKSVRQPAGGFTITLADKMQPLVMDSVYAMVEPMDLVEIRFCHDPSDASYAKPGKEFNPPVVMRGFVTNVTRDEVMGGDGRPSRRVVITGQDYGKLWQIFQIYYLQNFAMGEIYLSEYKFLEKYGRDAGFDTMQPVGDFLPALIKNVLNPYLKRLTWADGDAKLYGMVRSFSYKVSAEGSISPFVLSNFENVSLYQMLTTLTDVGAFNEIYTEDTEDAVNVVLRPVPFKSLTTGKYIQDKASAENVVIKDVDIQAINATRSDSGVANWFWVDVNRWNLMKDMDYRVWVQNQNPALSNRFNYENSLLARYCFRQMQTQISMGPPGASNNSDKGTEKAAALGQSAIYDQKWLDGRLKVLAESNKDNVVYESGVMKLRGNEKIKAGMYVIAKMGASKVANPLASDPECYAVQVDHEFMPFQGFYTTVMYERGTGFVTRNSKEVSPYLAEINAKGAA